MVVPSDFPADAREDRAGPLFLSVVVPVFNEGELVGELVERLSASCRRCSQGFELICVNDGSRDSTLPLLIQLSSANPAIRILDLERNFGHMAAISAGLARAGGDAVVVIDGDLQDPPELIPDMVQRWRGGANVVYGRRTGRHESLWRRALIRTFYALLARFSAPRIPASAGTFGLIDRGVVDLLNGLPERNRFLAGLRAWAGGEQVDVPYERGARHSGASRVGLLGQARLASDALTSFSRFPLRVASLVSLGCGFLLFGIGVVAFGIRAFTQAATPGWATFATLIGIMGLTQSIVLATLAEYVGVIFDEVKGRPLYLVREEFASGRPVGGEALAEREHRAAPG